jgi:hypothetical protein
MEILLEDNPHLDEDHSNEATTTSSWDPLKVIVPITNACLFIMAIIFVLALGIVFMIVLVAISKMYFIKSDSVWPDSWFWSI